MATTSVKAFIGSVQQLQKLPEKTARAAVKINTAVGVENAERAVARATFGSSRLRNAGANVKVGTRVVGKAGANLSVTSRLENNGTQGFVKAVGPWQLIENNSIQHFIGPAGLNKGLAQGRSGRSAAKSRLGRARALRTPYGLKRWVYVRGTTGKKPWEKAFTKTALEAPNALKQASAIEVGKMLR